MRAQPANDAAAAAIESLVNVKRREFDGCGRMRRLNLSPVTTSPLRASLAYGTPYAGVAMAQSHWVQGGASTIGLLESAFANLGFVKGAQSMNLAIRCRR